MAPITHESSGHSRVSAFEGGALIFSPCLLIIFSPFLPPPPHSIEGKGRLISFSRCLPLSLYLPLSTWGGGGGGLDPMLPCSNASAIEILIQSNGYILLVLASLHRFLLFIFSPCSKKLKRTTHYMTRMIDNL